jgi:hypothetical protein
MGGVCGEEVDCIQGFDETSYRNRELERTKWKLEYGNNINVYMVWCGLCPDGLK